MSSRYTPEPSQIDYHADVQVERVARAKKMIDPGDVLAVIDRRIADEPDPMQHPLQSSPQHPGSSSLLVIQVHGSKIAMREERVANWKICVNQWRNEPSFRD
jgi:hypothetical protein